MYKFKQLVTLLSLANLYDIWTSFEKWYLCQPQFPTPTRERCARQTDKRQSLSSLYLTASQHQITPTISARKLLATLKSRGRSGLSSLPAALHVPSPITVVASVIVAIVPNAYANRNVNDPFHELTATAGARLGAPSHEKP